MDKTFKWHLFFTSFIPLWISIIVIDIWNIVEWLIEKIDNEVSFFGNLLSLLCGNWLLLLTLLVLIVLLIISITSLNKFLKIKIKEKKKPSCKIIEAKHSTHLTADFILSYILPMVAFDFTECLSVVLFVIYFVVLAFICIRNNNVYVNFYFEARKYKMYICKLECIRANANVQYEECLVISRSDLDSEIGKEKNYWDFDNKIYIDITNEEDC